MGRRGPPRTPTAQLRLTGSWRANARERTEPQPPVEIPDPPPHLDKVGLATWRHLIPIVTRMRVMTGADGHSLAILCEAWSRYVRVTKALRGASDLVAVRNAQGQAIGVQRNPLWSMQIESESAVRRALGEFGLSPSTRAGISANGVTLPGLEPEGDGTEPPRPAPVDEDFSRRAFINAKKGA